MTAPNLAPETAAGGTALLIVDMIGRWDFPNAQKLLPGARSIVPALAALKRRCRAAGVPAIYANDNHGKWRSDFRQVTAEALEGDGASIARDLHPHEDDYFVLKPRHSAFFATPLTLLLHHLGVRRLIVTGVSGDQCVLSTATDAKMYDFEVVVPADTTACETTERAAQLGRHLVEVLGVKVTRAARVRLSTRGR